MTSATAPTFFSRATDRVENLMKVFPSVLPIILGIKSKDSAIVEDLIAKDQNDGNEGPIRSRHSGEAGTINNEVKTKLRAINERKEEFEMAKEELKEESKRYNKSNSKLTSLQYKYSQMKIDLKKSHQDEQELLEEKIKKLRKDLTEKKAAECASLNENDEVIAKCVAEVHDFLCQVDMKKDACTGILKTLSQEEKELVAKKQELERVHKEAEERDFFGAGLVDVRPWNRGGAAIDLFEFAKCIEDGLKLCENEMIKKVKGCNIGDIEELEQSNLKQVSYPTLGFAVNIMSRNQLKSMLAALKKIGLNFNPVFQTKHSEVKDPSTLLLQQKRFTDTDGVSKTERIDDMKLRLLMILLPPEVSDLPEWAKKKKNERALEAEMEKKALQKAKEKREKSKKRELDQMYRSDCITAHQYADIDLESIDNLDFGSIGTPSAKKMKCAFSPINEEIIDSSLSMSEYVDDSNTLLKSPSKKTGASELL